MPRETCTGEDARRDRPKATAPNASPISPSRLNDHLRFSATGSGCTQRITILDYGLGLLQTAIDRVGLQSMRDLSDKDTEIAFFVCDLYLNGEKDYARQDIVDIVYQERRIRITKEQIHRYLEYGRNVGWIRLSPPSHMSLRDELLSRFDLVQRFNVEPGHLHVVNAYDEAPTSSSAAQSVASRGAEVVMELIKQMPRSRVTKGSPIRIGLGSGRATRDFCRHFSQLMRSARPSELPPLELVAISSGCPAESPQYAPASFFNLFPTEGVTFVGLFAETVVRADHVDEIKRRPGVTEAFELRDAIDIVVTAMGDPRDEHDLLTRFMKQSGVDIPKSWVGNVQYRPYTADGPWRERDSDLRALTLFEIDDFVAMSRMRDRHVVLLARGCGLCENTRAAALHPLMTAMKVWSRCVIDLPTAQALVKLE